MGVVTVSSSASRTATAQLSGLAPRSGRTGRPASIVAFKTDRADCPAVSAAYQEPATLPLDQPKGQRQRRRPTKNNAPAKSRAKKPKESKKPGADDDLDYNEVAAALENLYKISPGGGGDVAVDSVDNVVRNRRRARRPSLDSRVRMRRKMSGDGEIGVCNGEDKKVERVVREYSVSTTDLVSLDWKKMKIPPVLGSSEQAWLFRLMQPMKAIFELRENLSNDLSKEPTDSELAAAVNMTVPQLRRRIEIGQAARNKLIKHNLRLVLFVINKYYQEMARGIGP